MQIKTKRQARKIRENIQAGEILGFLFVRGADLIKAIDSEPDEWTRKALYKGALRIRRKFDAHYRAVKSFAQV